MPVLYCENPSITRAFQQVDRIFFYLCNIFKFRLFSDSDFWIQDVSSCWEAVKTCDICQLAARINHQAFSCVSSHRDYDLLHSRPREKLVFTVTDGKKCKNFIIVSSFLILQQLNSVSTHFQGLNTLPNKY